MCQCGEMKRGRRREDCERSEGGRIGREVQGGRIGREVKEGGRIGREVKEGGRIVREVKERGWQRTPA